MPSPPEPHDPPPPRAGDPRWRAAGLALAAVPLAAAAADVFADRPTLFGRTLGLAAPPPAVWVAAGAAAIAAVCAPARRGMLAHLCVLALGVVWVLAADLALGDALGLELPRRRAVALACAGAAAVAATRAVGSGGRLRAGATALVALGVGAAALLHSRLEKPLRDAPQARGGRGAPIVLVTIDTTRRDALGCYGAPRDATPHIDAFAADAVRYTRAVSPSPHTHPAMASLLTGRAPLEHGSLSRSPHLAHDVTTLAEHCAAHGYATAGFLDNPWLHGGFGLERGYAYLEGGADLERVTAWLDRHGDAPFLLHVHLFQPHGPYEARAAWLTEGARTPASERIGDLVPARTIRAGEVPTHHTFTPDEIAWMRALQASETGALDAWFGAFVEALRARRLFERSVIVVAADHGEEFGERGGLHHSHTLFAELLDVPLLVRVPGGRGGVESRVTPLTDVHRTITGAAGLPPLAEVEGDGFAVSVRVRHAGRHHLRVTDGKWSLIVRATPGAGTHACALFDLDRDPGETNDVSEERTDVVEALLAVPRVAETLEGLLALPWSPRAESATPRVRTDLRALGYAR